MCCKTVHQVLVQGQEERSGSRAWELYAAKVDAVVQST